MTHTNKTGGTAPGDVITTATDPRLICHRVVLTVVVEALGVDPGDATNNAVAIVDETLADAADSDDLITTCIRGEFERSAKVISVNTITRAMRSGLLSIRLTADPNNF